MHVCTADADWRSGKPCVECARLLHESTIARQLWQRMLDSVSCGAGAAAAEAAVALAKE